jgi:translation initiation factor 2B subunit (eIF-2B alpha/beta/delta family)
MDSSLERTIAAIGADHAASATALLPRAVEALRMARDADRATLEAAARAVCLAQPCMGSIWNAAAAALVADPGELDRFAMQAERAPDAIVRFAVDVVREPAGQTRLLTWSASRPVERLVGALHARGPVAVACGEGRPALEGRALAARLTEGGVTVDLYPDGALASAVAGAAAVVVGADAVTAEGFINKAGTGALAAAAAAAGVPTYVLAGRDKCLAGPLARRLTLREGPGADVWADAPGGVRPRNPYFEWVAWPLVAGLITDRGPVGPGDVAAPCEAMARQVDQAGLDAVLGQRPGDAQGSEF